MNTKMVQAFRQRMKSGYVFGPFMKTTDPAFVETAGYAEMDFVILDMEHGPANLSQMQHNVRAAQIAGILPVIRVPELCESAISQALDIGAAGVQVPQVTTAEEARQVVRAAKFHPLGERGVCRFVRAARYSATPGGSYFSQANEDTLVIIQLEGKDALENLDEILEVDGVDVIFIGPYDLSQSLGVPGEIMHPKVLEQMKRIVVRSGQSGVAVGVFTDSEETMRLWINSRVQYISYSVDVGIFYQACANLVDRFNQIKEEAAPV